MEVLETFLKKFIKRLNAEKLLKEIMQDSRLKDLVIELNLEQLYESGTDAAGRSLGEYTAFTKDQKIEKGQRYDHITLKDSGKFYNSFKIIVVTDGFEIRVKDLEGKDSLIYRYGIDILGLDQLSMVEFQNILAIEIRKKILELL